MGRAPVSVRAQAGQMMKSEYLNLEQYSHLRLVTCVPGPSASEEGHERRGP